MTNYVYDDDGEDFLCRIRFRIDNAKAIRLDSQHLVQYSCGNILQEMQKI